MRGAAVVGGLLLALAGLLFYKHAIDQGWITPLRRILSGAVFGIITLGIGESLWRRRFRFAPDGISAAGCVILYGTIWAASRLYGFIGLALALPLMALVTAVCVFVAIRFRSQIVASIGLLGGFATPLLLSVHQEHPLGLFGYLLLLDLALLGLSRKQRWPMLSTMAIVGTSIVQVFWTAAHRHADMLPLALVAFGLFALLLTRLTPASCSSKRSDQLLELLSRAGAVLLPIGFALYFAGHSELSAEFWPLACFLGVLGLAALPLQRLPEGDWVPGTMLLAILAVAATWIFGNGSADIGYDWALSSAGLALLFTGGDLLLRRQGCPGPRSDLISPASILILGMLAISVLAVGRHGAAGAIWPYLILTLPLLLLLHLDLYLRSEQAPDVSSLRVVAALLAAILLGQYLNASVDLETRLLDGWTVVTLFAAAGLVALPALLLRWQPPSERRSASLWASELAASLFVLTLVVALAAQDSTTVASFRLELLLVLGFSMLASLISAARAPWVHSLSLLAYAVHRGGENCSLYGLYPSNGLGQALPWLDLLAFLALLYVPLMAPKSLGRRHLPMAASGLVLLYFYFPPHRIPFPILWIDTDPKGVLLVLVALGTGLLAGLRLTLGAKGSGPAIAWLGSAVSILFASLLARWLTPSPLTLTFALTLIAGFMTVVWSWRRWNALIVVAGLFALGGLITECVAIGQADPAYIVPLGSKLLFWNWPSGLAGLPVLVSLAISLLLRSGLGAKHRPRPNPSAQQWLRRLALLFAVMTAVHGFVWLNLQVLVAFSPGDLLEVYGPSVPARKLTMSLVWALYALVLLALGMLRTVPGLRQLSLVFLLSTLLKVFLYDLAGLEGLYRVGSLFGLAISMLLVSLLYQRFVFPRNQIEESQPSEEEDLRPGE